MNNDKQPENTPELQSGHKSVFATLDEQGIPVRFCHCVDWARKPDIDRAFGKYVKQEVVTNVFRVAVPDYRLCRYDFDDDAPLHRLSSHDGDLSSLKRFVAENGGKLTEEYPLIAAELIFFCFGEKPLVFDMEALRRGYDPVHPDAELRGKIENYIKAHREYLVENEARQKGVIIDTTSRGSLITENTGYGVKRSVEYLQYLADHYFDPKYKDISYYKQNVIPTYIPELYNWALESRTMFSLADFSLIPDNVRYHYPNINELPASDFSRQVSMEKNADAFSFFVNFTHVKVSAENNNIYSLLRIAEKGFAKEYEDKSSLVRKLFKDTREKIAALTPGKSDHSYDMREIQNQAQEKAVKILKDKFDIDAGACVPVRSLRRKNVKPTLKK